MTSTASRPAPPSRSWHGPGADRLARRRAPSLRWRRLLWSMLYPRGGQRQIPTLSGILLITLATGIGVAAYNTSNNILFITLSLLLSCLLLSGLLSWLNLRRVSWRIVVQPPLRVGQTAAAAIELLNHKRVLPTYGLWFDVRTTSEPAGQRLHLHNRLDPAGETRLDWTLRPTRRGRERLQLAAVGSVFPFGFLRKVRRTSVAHDVLVWPAPVEYQRFGPVVPARRLTGETVARVGHSGDLLALRRYATGDSHRLIHWKASARLRQLMVRQFASESQQGFSLWIESSPALWPRPEQFELLCRFATTLAEDLFTAGQLGTVAIDREPPQPVRRVRDLEAFFDRIALLEPRPETEKPAAAQGDDPAARLHRPDLNRSRRNLLTFAPEGARGVAAYVDGQKAAAA